MLFFEAVLAFASMLDEDMTHVNHHCAQIMNAATLCNSIKSFNHYNLSCISNYQNMQK